jgi:hypothetical protein
MTFECLLFSPRDSSLYSADREKGTRAKPKETVMICEVVAISKAVPMYL